MLVWNVFHSKVKLAAFACVEEGGFIRDLGQLEQAYQLGVRYITLVWNYESYCCAELY